MIRTEFDAEAAQLDLYLGFARGVRFRCPAKECAHGDCPVRDTVDKTWRHLDFFQHKALAAGHGVEPGRWQAMMDDLFGWVAR